MTDANRELFAGLEILEVHEPGASEPSRRAVAVAARIAGELGADVVVAGDSGLGPDVGHGLGKNGPIDEPAADWLGAGGRRVVLVAIGEESESASLPGNVVRVVAEPWHNEATLFAASGIADLFGEPDGAPLVPDGHWAAGTIAYAVLGALAAAQALAVRGDADLIDVDAVDALRWVNWKAIALASTGSFITREGAEADWPAMACRDGHLAFVFTARDWKAVVEMVDDERLRDERFARGRERQKHKSEYLSILREWASGVTRAEADALFLDSSIPGASISTAVDLPADETMVHRGSFRTVERGSHLVPVAVAPLRTEARQAAPVRPLPAAGGHGPLAGFRVLDLGVLTAGAGTSSLLADLGAEVIKIESSEKPDMFRYWAGNPNSPLFDFSNRSKLGVDLNLKDRDGRAQFLRLVEGADAVIENFRRGVLERLGIGFDDLLRANPAITLGSISGQGLTGPRAHHTTFGSTLEAASGMSAAVADPNGTPYVSGPNLNYPDQTVCSFAAAALTAAMVQSRMTGRGFHLDVSQLDVAVVAGSSLIEFDAIGAKPPNWRLQQGADGSWFALGSDGETRVAALDGRKLLRDCEAGRTHAVVHNPDGTLVKGFPFDLRDRPLATSGPAPSIGQHNELVLAALEPEGSS